MLKNIDPLVSADMLYALDTLDHRGQVAIVDASFLVDSRNKQHHIFSAGNSTCDVLEAVLTLLPLDSFTPYPMKVMKENGSNELPAAAKELVNVMKSSDECGHEWEKIDQDVFYPMVENVQLVISTSDTRPYSCVILAKGVIV